MIEVTFQQKYDPEELLDKVSEFLGATITSGEIYRDDVVIEVPIEDLRSAMEQLKNDLDMAMLVDITSVHWPDDESL